MSRFILLAITLFPLALVGQNIVLEHLAPLPMQTSNNAVVEGIVNGKTYVYSFGGIDESKVYSGIHLRSFRLDVEANEWLEIDPLPDSKGKIASSASRIGEVIYIIGGYHVDAAGGEVSSAKVHRFDTKENRFLSDGTDIPIPIDDQVQVVKGHLIYVITGWSNTRNIPQVQVYNTEEDSWSMANTLPNSNDYKVFGASGTIKGDTIFYYGGAGGLGFGPSKVLRRGIIDSTDPLEIDWTLVTPLESETNYRSAAVTVDNFVYWIGGSEGSYNFNGIAYNGTGGVNPSGTVVRYIEQIDQWRTYASEVPMDLRSVAQVDNNKFVIVGGMKANQATTSDVLLLTVARTLRVDDLKATTIRALPNPATNSINFSSDETIEQIEIWDFEGRHIKTIRTVDSSDYELDIAALAEGTYLAKLLIKGNKTAQHQFIKL